MQNQYLCAKRQTIIFLSINYSKKQQTWKLKKDGANL